MIIFLNYLVFCTHTSLLLNLVLDKQHSCRCVFFCPFRKLYRTDVVDDPDGYEIFADDHFTLVKQMIVAIRSWILV